MCPFVLRNEEAQVEEDEGGKEADERGDGATHYKQILEIDHDLGERRELECVQDGEGRGEENEAEDVGNGNLEVKVAEGGERVRAWEGQVDAIRPLFRSEASPNPAKQRPVQRRVVRDEVPPRVERLTLIVFP